MRGNKFTQKDLRAMFLLNFNAFNGNGIKRKYMQRNK